MRTISRIKNGKLLEVEYGLHKIGSQKPYFSVTGTLYRRDIKSRNQDMAGCIHDIVLDYYPGMEDIISLHLSDIDGIPMHHATNGYYWLAGTVPGGLGEEYHGGSGPSGKTPAECFHILCSHLRISEDEARDIREKVQNAIALTPGIKEGLYAGKKCFYEYVDSLKPRWKKEADAIISKYHLIRTDGE